MRGEVAITLEVGGPVPQFGLSRPDGSPPRIVTIGVADMAAEEPLWWLVPASFTSVFPFTVGDVSEAEVDALAAGDYIDPLEDLPPSDPLHQWAVRQREDVEQRVFVSLRTLTYGIVPMGFRQAVPQHGPPPPLIPGREYAVQAMGLDMDAAHLVFRGA